MADFCCENIHLFYEKKKVGHRYPARVEQCFPLKTEVLNENLSARHEIPPYQLFVMEAPEAPKIQAAGYYKNYNSWLAKCQIV